MTSDVRLEVEHLTKQFGSTVVLDDVSLAVRRGQIHGLIGQNGAGKSTLVKVLAGIHADHGGRVLVDGAPVALRTPRESRREGIAVIHQEFSLVPSMSVAENLVLGQEAGRVAYSAGATRRAAEDVVAAAGIDVGVPLATPVRELGPALMQRIEIAKALGQRASVLVMDEPTARLSEREREWLFTTMRRLSDEGVGIVFISHFLEEVRQVTDWLSVLRGGVVVRSAPTAGLPVGEMAELMLGEELRSTLGAHASRADDGHRVVLEAARARVGSRLRGVDCQLRQGEILGVAGLVGSGRTRLARLLTGVDAADEGVVTLRGARLAGGGPRGAVGQGVALVPEDRKHQGLSLRSPVGDNLVLMALQRRLGGPLAVPRSRVDGLARQLVEELEVHPARTDLPAGALSGGNQQKVLLGKALASRPDVLVVDQPTAGVDVGTKAQIHRLLHAEAEAGAALAVVTDDLEELYALADRLLVMHRGTVLWRGLPAQLPRDELLTMMATGVVPSHLAGAA
ncbi:sugar ABC transporter ATP-binding protein [Motilibacter rhizosphaerae]|nr:sugar ABC transporter ATP-binding protein [Motilibacter rhizosphaerae]